MRAGSRVGGRRRRLLLAATAAATLLPAASASALAGSDSFQDAPALLFSVPGFVNNQTYGTQGTAEPVAPGTAECPAMGHTAWWRFAGTGQTIKLSTQDSNFDTVLAVFDPGGGSPIGGATGNRVACNNDDGAGGSTSEVTFSSTRGRSYLVQVGGRLAFFGTIGLRASSPVRPGNDDRITPTELTSGTTSTVNNSGASQEIGELLTCATVPYAATMWFRWTATAVGDVVFTTTAAFETSLNVGRPDGTGGTLGCATGAHPRVALRVNPGDVLLLQVGSKGADTPALGQGPVATTATFTLDPDADNDGELASTDCNDANPAIRHGIVDIPDDGIDQNCDGADAINLDRDGDGSNRPADCNDANPSIGPGSADVPDDGIDQNCDGADAINLDRDSDGFNRPGDCNDASPKIHPQARDIPGNKIDEDCTAGPAPFPRLESTVRTFYLLPPLRFTDVTIVKPVAGSKVELRCRGTRCFKRKVVQIKKSSKLRSVLIYVRRARLKRGAVVEVRITKSAHVGFVRRLTVRGGTRAPKLEDLCLPVGASKPTSC